MQRVLGGEKIWIAGLLVLAATVYIAVYPRFAVASEIRIKVPLTSVNINPGGETSLGNLSFSSRPISLRIFPNSSCIIVPEDKVQLQVKALLENGTEIDVTTSPYTTYSSSDAAIVSVSSSGQVSSLGSGKGYIRAEYLLAVAYTEITTNPSLSIVEIQPLFGLENSDEMLPEETAPTATASIPPGESAQLSILATLSNGEACNLSGNLNTTYTSLNPQIANADGVGQAVAGSLGRAQINISAAGKSTYTYVDVQFRDETAPATDITFGAPVYLSNSGLVHLSTNTYVQLTPSDPQIANTHTSGVSFTGVSIDDIPSTFSAFWRYLPFTIFEGTHTVYFLSRDYAGNTEVIKSTVVVVDGTAPSPLTGIVVAGAAQSVWRNTNVFNITWTNPEDVAGIGGVRVKYGEVAPLSNEDGVFYPADGSLVYSSTEVVSGVNVIWLWLEDNVGNADPAMAASVELRYDAGLPASTASAPAFSGVGVVPVVFVANDAVSGVDRTALWARNNGAAWSASTYTLAGTGGKFGFDTAGAGGSWEFYTQAFDKAGNGEPVPVSTTPAKAQTAVDVTPPVISNVRVTEITYDTARVTWETDDEASAVLEYTLPGASAVKTYASSYYTSQSLFLSGLVYPANYTFKITAANRAGLSAVYTGGAFYVPPKMTTNVNDLGVMNTGQPIIIEVTNPYVSSLTYTLNGQTVTQNVTLNTPLEIYVNSGQGPASLSLNLDGYVYSNNFVVDTATRTVYLARFVVAAGGLDAAQGGYAALAAVGQPVAAEVSNIGGKTYLGYYAGIDPVAPGSITDVAAAAGPARDQAALSWTAPGDDAYAGTAMRYDIRWATSPIDASNFSAAARAAEVPFPAVAGTAQTAYLSGLNLLATYYFSVRTEDELGNFSGLSNAASVFKGYVLAGTVTVNGVSEISFMSPVEPQVALISTISAVGAVAIGSAAAGGLTLAGNMYEIGPEGTYDPPAVLTFYYSTSTLAALGLQEQDVAVYEHFPETGWVKLPGQVLDTQAHKLTVPITRIASLFAIFGIVRDRAAPVSAVSYAGVSYQADGKTFIGAGSSVTLAAYDPVVYGTSTGVAFTEYRVDPGTTPAFAAYTGPFPLTEGFHAIEYRSRDYADNLEPLRYGEVYADATAPATDVLIEGTTGQAGWYVSAATVTMVSTDSLSGLAAVYYRAGASTEPVKYAIPLVISSEGVTTLHYFAADNVANAEAEKTILLKIDRTPPAIVISSPAAGAVFIAAKDKIGVYYSVNDNLDPAFTATAMLTQIEDRGSPRGVRPSTIAVTAGQLIEPLSIDDGVWVLSVLAQDAAGNISTAAAGGFEVVHDILPPRSVLNAETAKNYLFGGGSYVRGDTGFSLSSIDDLTTPADGAGLGVKRQLLRITGAPAAAVELVFENPVPTPGGIFLSTFTLAGADGAYLLAYNAEDMLVNTEEVNTSTFVVDNTAPRTAFVRVSGSAFLNYAAASAVFALQAEDPGLLPSGVSSVTWSDNGGEGSNLTSGLAFGEGRHALAYRAVDNLGNLEVTGSSTVFVDNTAPEAATHIGLPYFASGVLNYITPATPITFTAADPVAAEVASGVERIEVSIDGSSFTVYAAALKFGEGRYVVKYRAVDNVGNTETARTLELQSDNTSPVSAWQADGEQLELAGKFYLSAIGRIALESYDPVVSEVASGVEGIYYGIDAAPSGKYAAPFGLAEGVRTLNFSARDNVANVEVAKSTVIYVDGTKPVTELSVAGDQYRSDKVYISTRSGLMLASMDPLVNEVASGVRETSYAVDGGTFAAYSLFNLSAEGKRVVSFYSVDQVGNVEAVKTSELWVDATAPATALAITGARHDADGFIYITRDSGIVLAAADPINSETASGVLLTKYRVDGGNWQVYAGSFTITAEGRHTLEYQSLDRVLNTETIRTAAFAVDNTPPAASITLGEPKYEAFGLPLITPETSVSLAAADIVSGEVASGLARISYELIAVADGSSEVRDYTEPFKLAQGTYDIRFWSVDKVGNIEAYKQLRLAVSTLRDGALAAVAGLDLSGTADIAGAVRSNAVVSVSGSARIFGDVTASTITLSGTKAQITGQQLSGATPLAAEPILLAVISTAITGVVAAEYLMDGKLTVAAQAVLTLSTGTYYVKGIELSGGSEIRVNGKVDIYVDGDITISGGSALNASGTASGLNIFVGKISSITFTGGGNFVGVVYAPYSHLKLAGNALLGGHYFVRSAAVSGTGNLVQAGETLPAAVPVAGGGKKVSALSSGSSYSVLAGPDPEFKLGEVYVYPNPAKNGQAPTIHLECGIADSVNIKIYTVSGREAHEYTITSAPEVLDDGNGLPLKAALSSCA